MNKGLVIAGIVVGAIVVMGGGAAAVAFTISQKGRSRLALLMPIFQREAAAVGVPVSWLLGIAGWETRGGFNPLLVAGKGTADETRGGSFGVMQMSYETAQGLGYDGPELSLDNVDGYLWQGPVPVGSLLDPPVNIHYGALYVAQLRDRFGGSFADVASGYNSGKPLANAPSVTRTKYVPGALAAQQQFAPADQGQAVV